MTPEEAARKLERLRMEQADLKLTDASNRVLPRFQGNVTGLRGSKSDSAPAKNSLGSVLVQSREAGPASAS
jgi:hypothetical protein